MILLYDKKECLRILYIPGVSHQIAVYGEMWSVLH